MLARFERLLAPIRLALNLRRVWLLVIIWALLANFALQTQREILFRLSYLILLIVILSFLWALYSIQSFRLERKLTTPRTQVGQVSEERLTALSSGRLPKLFIELNDFSDLPGYHVGRVLSAMAPRVKYNWTVRTLCLKRGRYRLGPITAASGDPFGLFMFRRVLPDTSLGLTVYPMVVDLTAFTPPLGYMRGGETIRRRTHFITTNVSGTREYVPGDSFNRIHWPSSARHDRLIVKEFELDPTADVWLFLDMDHTTHYGARGEDAPAAGAIGDLWEARKPVKLAASTEEYTVTLAASIGKYFLDRQRAVGLAAIADQPMIIQPDRGERQLPRLLEVLGVLGANGRTPFAQLLAQEMTQLARNLTLVCITASTDGEWVRYAHHMQKSGQRLIVVLLDPSTFGTFIDAGPTFRDLTSGGIPTYLVREGDDLRSVLSLSTNSRRGS